MGRGKSQAEPVTGKSISCRESLCPGHCKSYKIEIGMGFDTRKVMDVVAQTPAGGGLDIMWTKRFQKTSGAEQCSWQNYVDPEGTIQTCSSEYSVETEVPLIHIYKFNGQTYVKIQALKFDIKNGVAKFR